MEFRKVDVFFADCVKETGTYSALVELGEGRCGRGCNGQYEYQSSESVHNVGILLHILLLNEGKEGTEKYLHIQPEIVGLAVLDVELLALLG